MASKAELRRREELARFNAEIMELKGDELLDRIIAFDALPPPDSSEENLRRAMRYSVGAALIKEFGVGKGYRAKVARLAALRETKTHGSPLRGVIGGVIGTARMFPGFCSASKDAAIALEWDDGTGSLYGLLQSMAMTINLEPEDEKLIQKRLQTGVFGSPQEVIHRALESLDAEESWLQENKGAINEKIERGIAQFERGEGLTPEDSLAQLEARKAAWRADRE